MKNVLGLILKREEVVIDGKKVNVLSYFTSMGTPKKIKSITLSVNDKDESVSHIRDFDKDDADYYYVPAKIKDRVDDDLIVRCNDRYRDSYFMYVDGKVEEIRDVDYIEKIDKYISDNSINSIYEDITSNVIGQDEHVRSILSSILWNNHLINSGMSGNNIAKNKHNILIMGKSGTGKTEIIKEIADSLNLPVVVENAPSYSLLDGDGSPIDKMLLDLVYVTDGDMELAKRGILVIDNFDKLLTSVENYGHLTSDYVQKELFKLIDGDVRKFKYDEELISLDTHGLTIVLLGDFDRVSDKVIGFDYNNGNVDLVSMGLKKELLDRINKIRKLNSLSKSDLIDVLKSQKGKLMSTLSYYKEKGVNIRIDEDGLAKIADMAIKDGHGVRSLNKIVDNLMDSEFNDIMFSGKKKRREL